MSPRKPFRYWPVVGVATLAAAMFLSNQTVTLPQGGLAIRSNDEYKSLMTKVEDLTEDRIKTYDAGKALSKDDLAKLREAGEIVDRMNAYAPLMANFFYLSGKIHHILGEDSVAEERFRQCTLGIARQIAAQPEDGPRFTATGADAAYQLSGLLLLRHDLKGALEQADAAVKAAPQSSDYVTARASALNELRRIPEAKRDLATALRLDPSNRRAAMLLHMIESDKP